MHTHYTRPTSNVARYLERLHMHVWVLVGYRGCQCHADAAAVPQGKLDKRQVVLCGVWAHQGGAFLHHPQRLHV